MSMMVVKRDREFTETFNIRLPDGRPMPLFGWDIVMVVEHHPFYTEFRQGQGLVFNIPEGQVILRLTKEKVQSLPFGTLYYTIYAQSDTDRKELDRGVIRIQ